MNDIKKKIKRDKDGNEYIFEIVIYLNDYSLVVDIDGKEDEDKELIFELKRQSLKKNLIVNLLELIH